MNKTLAITLAVFMIGFAHPSSAGSQSGLVGYPENAKYPYDESLTIHIDGDITVNTSFGVVDQLEAIPDDAPYVIVAMRSNGGFNDSTLSIQISLAKYVHSKGIPLVTYAYDYCHSNCTVLFAYGNHRIADKSTIFGFHGSSYEYGGVFSSLGTLDMVQSYRKAPGIDQNFVDSLIGDGVLLKYGTNNITVIPNDRLFKAHYIMELGD